MERASSIISRIQLRINLVIRNQQLVNKKTSKVITDSNILDIMRSSLSNKQNKSTSVGMKQIVVELDKSCINYALIKNEKILNYLKS